MLAIAVSAIPAQRFQVVLDGQYCTITLRQKGGHIYLDLDTADTPVCRGAVCVHGASVVQSPSPYFKGSLHFFDTEGKSAPEFGNLNSRYKLFYVPEGETVPAALKF